MFRILIVEDDKGSRTLMKEVIGDAGYEPITAADGIEALETLDHKHIDLIIMDIMMPKMDGYELLHQLRSTGMDMPVLMITAKNTLTDKKQGFYLGADDYMTKPVDEEEMLLRIAALLRRAKISAEHRLVIGSTELNYDSLSVNENGTISELPKKEFLLLYKYRA